MPTSIIAAGIAGWASGAVAGGTLAAFSASAFYTSLALGVASRALAKKPDSSSLAAAAQARTVTIRSPVAPWRVIYGQERVGGVITYKEVTNNSKHYHLIITLAGHVCEEIGEIYFNDEQVTEDAFGNATGKWAGHAYFQRSLGAEAGQPFPDLVGYSAGKWTDAHRQTGRTKLYVLLVANPDLYPGGLPNISAVVKGKKVYDSRSATWVWSDNPTLCVNDYLTSTAYGMGADYATEIDATELTASANICDETVTLKAAGTGAGYVTSGTYLAGDVGISLTGGTGTFLPGDTATIANDFASDGITLNRYYIVQGLVGGMIVISPGLRTAISSAQAVNIVSPTTETRYTCNGTFLTSETPQSIIEKMLTSMAGFAVPIGGTWKIIAGAYTAPTVTLDENDAAGAIEVQPLLSRRESFNAVKGVFVNPANSWQPQDFPAITSTAYETEDGGARVFKDIQLEFTTSGSMAQRLAKIELRRARQALSSVYPGKLSCYRVQPGKCVALNNTKFGWAAKAFFISAGRFVIDREGRLGYTLMLRETAAAVYDWTSSEEQTVDIAPNTTLADPFYAPVPTALTLTATVYDQTGLVATFSWTSPDSPYNDSYAVKYRIAAGTWAELPNTETTDCQIRGLDHNVTYEFAVASVNHLGVTGTYATLTQLVVYPTLPGPASVTIWAANDGQGHATRMRVKAALSSVWAYVPDGLSINVAVFDSPNEVTVDSGGTGTDLTLSGAHVLASGSDFTVITGSTTAALIVRPATNPLPVGINLAGMFWAQFTTSQWRKCTSYDETMLYFADVFDVAPVAGDTVNWAELAWFDDRGSDTPDDFAGNNRLAILDNGTNYEIIRWSALTETGGVFHLTATRAQEGTSAISATGQTLRYFPAPGPGTRIIDVPKSSFVGDPTTSVTGEVDIDVAVQPWQTVSISANAYRNSAGGSIRSYIVPAIWGGEL